jgi:hypothetical protein
MKCCEYIPENIESYVRKLVSYFKYSLAYSSRDSRVGVRHEDFFF